MSNRIHEMYRILQECGEDASCGCGCEPKKTKKGKKVLENLVGAERVTAALTEVRRKSAFVSFAAFEKWLRLKQVYSKR